MKNSSSRRWRRRILPLAGLCLSLAPVLAQEGSETLRRTAQEESIELGLGRLVPDLELLDLRGQRRQLSELLDGRQAVVIAMTSAGCPLSKLFAPRVAALEDEFRERGIDFVYVNGVASESVTDMQQQIREQGFDGPYLPDVQRTVARELGARTTTEVFVLDRARTLVYRGAVDDQYGVGSARSAAREHFLRQALEAVLREQRPRIEATWPPGCLLDVPAVTEQPPRELTYNGRISRILARRCVTCHRPGGVAPFGLESFAALRGRTAMVEAVVRDGLMPPWHGASPEPWRNGRVLPEQERADLLAWLASSQPLGELDQAPVLPPLSQTWTIGSPQLLVSTTNIELPASGPLQYARRVVATDLTEQRWVSALELRPAKPGTVHHALVWLLPPGARLPAVDEMPGELELLGAFSPGDGVLQYAQGSARRLPAGSLLVVDIYALAKGRGMDTRLRIGMRFAGQAPSDEVGTLVLQAAPFTLPASTADATASAELVLSEPLSITALTPYMRARGRAVVLRAKLPDGTSQVLLDAPHYDFRWQIRHERRAPLSLPAGTRLTLRGTFDSSAQNPNNPDPDAPARDGPQALDEALFVALEFERPRARDAATPQSPQDSPGEPGEPGTPGARPSLAEQRAQYPIDTCIVGGGALDSMGGPVDCVYRGRLLLLCCEACEPIFLSAPGFYLEQLDAAAGASSASDR